MTVVLATIYLGFHLWPSFLFRHQVAAGNVVLHARVPLPPEAKDVAERARALVSRSPFYRPTDTYHVFLADTPALFAFFAPNAHDVGGVSEVYLTGHVFLRPSHVGRDRLLSPSGREVDADRPLSYYIAHEVAHTMVGRRVGRRGYALLETWQREGYADYIGKGGRFDLDATRRAFRDETRELDPQQSGRYLRYHLLVAELLDRRGMSAEDLLSKPRDAAPIEERLRAF